MNLEINEEKTKYMQINSKYSQKELEISLTGAGKMTVEKVNRFIHFLIWITGDGNNSAEVKARIVKGD